MRAMQELTGLSVQKLAMQMNQPKCYGVAKNFFTQAMKTNPEAVVKPEYPYMFHKPFSW